jgi:hypothetical protein
VLSTLAAVFALACAPPGGAPASGRTAGDGGTSTDDAYVPPPGPDTGPPPVPTPPTEPDADGDGLPDADEVARGTDPSNADTDGDGLGDGVEILAGTDPLDAASTIPETDFYVVLPYAEAPELRELDFTARLGKGDVFFLIDTTGSMGGSIDNVRSTLSSVIVPALDASIADASMGVGEFQDFATSPYGNSGNYAFQLRQTVTDSVPAVQSALAPLRAYGGADIPESMTEALYETAAGGCSSGAGRGAACFRTDATPIVVVVTDAPTHNGPGGAHPYSFGARQYSESVAALNAIGAKVLGVAVSYRDHLVALANDTTSRRADGSPAVYPAPGGTVDSAVVDGIVDLVGGVPQDVSRRTIDDPTDDVDATEFIKAVRPVRATRMVSMDDTTFFGVPGGTTVTFEVTFQNDFLEHGDVVRIFRAEIEVHDLPGLTALDTRNVYIVVPRRDGSILI